MKFIQSLDHLDTVVSESTEKEFFICPLYSNNSKFYQEDSILGIYLYSIYEAQEYYINIQHPDCIFNLEGIDFSKYSTCKFFLINKRKFKYFIPGDYIDVHTLYFYHTCEEHLPYFTTPCHDYFTINFKRVRNINRIIPLTKHIELFSLQVDWFLDSVYSMYDQQDSGFHKFNSDYHEFLSLIEKNPISYDIEQVNKHYQNAVISDSMYSNYSMYTTTSRPSCHSNFGINLAAIKKDDHRKIIIPGTEDRVLLSVDFESYHIRLLADIIKFKFPAIVDQIGIHKYLAHIYYGKDNLTEEEYSKAKSITFRYLYSNIRNIEHNIEFFNHSDKYADVIWEKYCTDGYVETMLFKRPLKKEFFNGMSAHKLLSYLLQSYETERNISVMTPFISLLSDDNSKAILYTYDSILIDCELNKVPSIVNLAKSMLTDNNKFPVKFEVGKNFADMYQII